MGHAVTVRIMACPKADEAPEMHLRMYMNQSPRHLSHPSHAYIKLPMRIMPIVPSHILLPSSNSRNIKQPFQLLNQSPLIIADVRPVILLQSVDALPGDQRVQRILFLPVSTVDRLIGTFDFDGDGGLAALDHGDLFVVALD